MAELRQVKELTPPSYPDTPTGLSEKAAALDTKIVWDRIDAYINWRFAERSVTFIFDALAGDDVELTLQPLISQSAEFWSSAFSDFTPVTLLNGPYGLCFPESGTYRISAQIGAGPTPSLIEEAFRRLAEYMAAIDSENKGGWFNARPGETQYDATVSDGVQRSGSRNAAWAAKAMVNSGAADLLRPYRKAK